MTEPLLTPEDMAEALGAPVSTVMEWNRKQKWPHVKLGRRFRWTPEQFDEIVRRHSVTPKRGTVAALDGQTARSAARNKAS